MLRFRYIVAATLTLGWHNFIFSNPIQASVLTQNSEKKTSNALNCNSFIPIEEGPEQYEFIKKWSNYVARKAFSLSHFNLNNQLLNLKQCFTNSGWDQFEQALHRSGNISVMTSNQLSSNAQTIGPVIIQQQKTQQTWTTEIPLRVVYQNKNQKIIQKLNVHLLITELPNHHLGVMQIIGVPVKKPDTLQKEKTKNIIIP